MRVIYLLFITLLFSESGLCQTFNFEHHFLEGNVELINLDVSGTKYLVVDKESNQMNFYDSDYTLWKSINLPVPDGYTLFAWPHISEGIINSDANLEIAFIYILDNAQIQVPHSRIVSETGTILKEDNFVRYSFSELAGLDTKLFYTSHPGGEFTICSLSGLIPEFTFPRQLNRIKLEISGEKYYSFNPATQSVEFLNADYSIWKNVPIESPVGNTYISIQFVSETAINPDDTLEICYISSTDCLIINELGDNLLNVPGAYAAKLDRIEGLSDKLMVKVADNGGNWGETISVFSLPVLEFEHQYSGHQVGRIKLENSGEKYYVAEIGPYYTGQNQILLYNSEHELWKTILLPVGPVQSVINVSGISETAFAADDKVEAIYTTNDEVLLDTYFPESHIINETGQILFSQPVSAALQMSMVDGAPKLFSQIIYGDFGTHYLQSKIFAIDNAMQVSEQLLNSITIYPNPSPDTFYIESQEKEIITIEIINLNGQLVDRLESFNIVSYNCKSLRTGMYFMRLTDSDLKKSVQKIFISE